MPRRARLYMGRFETSRLWKKTLPSSGSSMPTMQRKDVVFPAPLRPRRPTISEGSMAMLTPRTTSRPLNDFLMLEAWRSGISGECSPLLMGGVRVVMGAGGGAIGRIGR